MHKSIMAVHLIVRSQALALAGGVVMNLPSTLFPSVDEELAKSGKIRSGDLLHYIGSYGYKGPIYESAFSEIDVRTYATSNFMGHEWACCGRQSSLAHYHVIVAFS
jgi:hypothetical protein